MMSLEALAAARDCVLDMAHLVARVPASKRKWTPNTLGGVQLRLRNLALRYAWQGGVNLPDEVRDDQAIRVSLEVLDNLLSDTPLTPRSKRHLRHLRNVRRYLEGVTEMRSSGSPMGKALYDCDKCELLTHITLDGLD